MYGKPQPEPRRHRHAFTHRACSEARTSPRPIGGHAGRRGGASADTCARSGGPSSFSLNAADMVSVCAPGSERGRRDVRPPPRAGEPRRGVALRDPGRARGGGGTWNPVSGERGSRSRGRPCRAPGPRVRSGGELPGARVGDGGAAAGSGSGSIRALISRTSEGA